MAVTNLKQKEGRIMNHPDMIGSGAPADGDTLCTDVAKYPIGSTYYDYTNSKLWIRKTVSGANAADWKGVVLS